MLQRVRSPSTRRPEVRGDRLVDAAIADGRINTAGKEAYLKLFDTDFESAKATLRSHSAPQIRHSAYP